MIYSGKGSREDIYMTGESPVWGVRDIQRTWTAKGNGGFGHTGEVKTLKHKEKESREVLGPLTSTDPFSPQAETEGIPSKMVCTPKVY